MKSVVYQYPRSLHRIKLHLVSNKLYWFVNDYNLTRLYSQSPRNKQLFPSIFPDRIADYNGSVNTLPLHYQYKKSNRLKQLLINTELGLINRCLELEDSLICWPHRYDLVIYAKLFKIWFPRRITSFQSNVDDFVNLPFHKKAVELQISEDVNLIFINCSYLDAILIRYYKLNEHNEL